MSFNQLLRFLLATTATIVTISCGGGGETQVAITPGAGGSGVAPPSLTVGAISGFGSVIVNGVRYDNSASKVEIEDGDDDGGGLKLGNVVRLEGKVNDDKVSGRADKIEMGAEVKGPVEVKLGSTSFIAVGATVNTNSFTVYDNVAADLSNLNAGDIVQVHGLPDANGVVTATRVQKRTAPLALYKTVGAVAASPAPTATQFKLGTLSITYSAAVVSDLPVPPAPGTIVRVKINAQAAAPGSVATQVRPFVSGPKNGATEAELNGFVADLAAGGFKINGLPVNFSAATVFERGTAADLVNGRLVEIEGSITNGVITARTIKFEDVSGKEFQFEGPISDFASSADFTVKGQRTDASGANVRFDGGTVADLANGKQVEVRGSVIQGGKLIATRVKFK
jgi:Domain of unknown function (DUF5666)